MYDENTPYGETEEKIVAEFRKDASHIGIPNVSIYDDSNHYFWDIKEMRKKFLQYGSLQHITDVLVRGMFHEHNVSKKSALFDCFGDQIYQNLNNNLPEKTQLCHRCGKRFVIESLHQSYCKECEPIDKPKQIRTAECVICGASFKTRNLVSGAVCPACQMHADLEIKVPRTIRKSKKTRQTHCVDCGICLDTYSFGRPSIRCRSCQSIRNREKVIEWKIKYNKTLS